MVIVRMTIFSVKTLCTTPGTMKIGVAISAGTCVNLHPWGFVI